MKLNFCLSLGPYEEGVDFFFFLMYLSPGKGILIAGVLPKQLIRGKKAPKDPWSD